MIGAQLHLHLSRDIFLGVSEEGLDVTHHRLQVLCLMHQLSVPVGELLLPVELLLGEHMLLKQMMCLDDDQRCRCLKSYTPLGADDGITHMHIAADAVFRGSLVQKMDQLYWLYLLAVHRYRLSLFKTDGDTFRALCSHL